ncbi:MAG: tellurite resistance TerB family protein [Xanthomonadales bacterium]|nr:tellurite resistance TerB family protein [Xanthomonadales bacterium]
MDTTRLLDHLLASARDLAADTRERVDQASQKLQGDGIAGMRLDRPTQGLLAGGALALLLGSRSGRRLARLGGLAALGTVAYRTWQQHQAPPAADPAPADVARASWVAHQSAKATITGEQRSRAILSALIAAAKADGHIDPRQRALIQGEIEQLAPDAGLRTWLEQQLQAPMDAAAVAAQAITPEMSAELYLASVLVINPDNGIERDWLDTLAAELGLDPVLRRSLDQQLN